MSFSVQTLKYTATLQILGLQEELRNIYVSEHSYIYTKPAHLPEKKPQEKQQNKTHLNNCFVLFCFF